MQELLHEMPALYASQTTLLYKVLVLMCIMLHRLCLADCSPEALKPLIRLMPWT